MSIDPRIFSRLHGLAHQCDIVVWSEMDRERDRVAWSARVQRRPADGADSFVVTEPTLAVALARAATEADARGWSTTTEGPPPQ